MGNPQAAASRFFCFYFEGVVKHRVTPIWLARANGKDYNLPACGPIPGGLLLTHTQFNFPLEILSLPRSRKVGPKDLVSTMPLKKRHTVYLLKSRSQSILNPFMSLNCLKESTKN